MLNRFNPDSFIGAAAVGLPRIEPKVGRALDLPIALNLAQRRDVLQPEGEWTDTIGAIAPDVRDRGVLEAASDTVYSPARRLVPALRAGAGRQHCHER
ncbi:hypothetical protein [Novosphingobium sp. P6W]|uniref:hypothetical protein n=1 Tax=Novosphingobium sp. P6W TaxID=1609758 RepID=UPI0005C3015A|nr:hypothetical protein [Novosphingobium sp. P6W]AXB80623.1 hypothetical protein TQ38_029010 [Novosphingobium sp. P6W]KIS29564.1 hypothetical protein TQ38_28040 [Novosphingobium sp. P6W]